MKYLVTLIFAMLLSACATDPSTVKTLVEAQQAANARPTLALKCPAGGCEFEYTDPRDRAQLKMPTNGWDAVTSLGNNITSLVPIIVTGRIATAGFDALKNSGGVTTTTTTSTTTGATSVVGDSTSMTGSTGVLGAGTYSTQANPTTTTPAPVVVTPVVQVVPTVITPVTPIVPTVINQPVVVPPVVVNPDTVVITPAATAP